MHWRPFIPALAAILLEACTQARWPRPDSYEGFSSVSDMQLIQDREDHASKITLGSTEDVREIKILVIKSMRTPDASGSAINQISWLSKTEVIVESSWSKAPMDYPICIYVLQKKDTSWQIVTRYLLAGA
jgi:hypothetical protein